MARALSSSYSRFDTHIFLKVSNDAKMEPLHQEVRSEEGPIRGDSHKDTQWHTSESKTYPIHVEYSLSWGAEICQRETRGHWHLLLRPPHSHLLNDISSPSAPLQDFFTVYKAFYFLCEYINIFLLNVFISALLLLPSIFMRNRLGMPLCCEYFSEQEKEVRGYCGCVPVRAYLDLYVFGCELLHFSQ